MDEVDVLLCQRLLRNSRAPYKELARDLGMTVPAAYKRVQGLVDAGIVRGFVAEVDISALNGLPVMVFGRSEAPLLSRAVDGLAENDAIASVLFGGGNQMYVNAFLRGAGDIDGLLDTVRARGQVPRPVLGMHMVRPDGIRVPSGGTALSPLDLRILRALRSDSRRKLTEVASEVGVSARTVRLRLDRMIKEGSARLTIEWSPDFSRDVVAIVHLAVRPDAERGKALGLLRERFGRSTVYTVAFSNLPDTILLTVWLPSMRAVCTVCEEMFATGLFESVVPQLIYSGLRLVTWKDRLLDDAPRAERAVPASPPAPLR
jgi:Lrp/AsnC family leucine-responsive transcriptional regulator